MKRSEKLLKFRTHSQFCNATPPVLAPVLISSPQKRLLVCIKNKVIRLFTRISGKSNVNLKDLFQSDIFPYHILCQSNILQWKSKKEFHSRSKSFSYKIYKNQHHFSLGGSKVKIQQSMKGIKEETELKNSPTLKLECGS